MKIKYYGLLMVVGMLFVACGGAENPEAAMDAAKGILVEPVEAAMEEVESGDTLMEEGKSENAIMDGYRPCKPCDEFSSDEMMDGDNPRDKSEDAMMDGKEPGDEASNDEMIDGDKPRDDDVMMDDDGDDATMDGDKPRDGDDDDTMMPKADLPDWFNVQLTDVNTGETFAVADLQGKVVLVETLAVWCSNCLRQQNQVKELHELLGERDDLVSLGLDIDPNESDEVLKGHTTKNDFDWVYAVASRELAREIGLLYGDQFLNPPSTPMFIIDQNGETHLLPFGIKSAADLNAALEPFLTAGM